MRSILIAVTMLAALPLTASAAILYSDAMDAGSAAGWTINLGGTDIDSAQTFGYDYSIDDIPEAPHTTAGNATTGLKLEANLVAPNAVSYMTLVPTGQNFTGTHQLRFDFWMNYPVGSGFSTEFMGGGVGHDGLASDVNSGAQVIWTGDGGSASDWRALKSDATNTAFFVPPADMAGGTRQGSDPYYANFMPAQAPPAGQFQVGSGAAGSPSFKWYTFIATSINQGAVNKVRIEIEDPVTTNRLKIVDLRCNDTSDGSLGCTTEGNVSLFYADFFTSVSDGPTLQFGLIDNVVVENIPEPASLALLGLGGLLALRRRR